MLAKLWFRACPIILTALLLPFQTSAQVESEGLDPAVAQHMHQHLSAMSAMKTFIIAGQLDGMREPAVWLEEHEATPGLPGEWQPYVAELRRYAGNAATARHLVFGAASVSEMARVCGNCHQANEVQVEFTAGATSPPDGNSVSAQMLRHLWAVNRMWEGLIAPSDDAWEKGAEVLSRLELSAADISAEADIGPKVVFLLMRAREIGEESRIADTRKARSALYGELLALCADCHALTQGGPTR